MPEHQPPTETPEIARRDRMDKWTPAEKAIFNAVQHVEELGGSQALTDACMLLSRARERVADHVDGV